MEVLTQEQFKELYERIKKDMFEKIEIAVEEVTKDNKPDDILCSYVNAVALGTNIVSFMAEQIQAHVDHHVFVNEVVDMIKVIMPKINALTENISHHIGG